MGSSSSKSSVVESSTSEMTSPVNDFGIKVEAIADCAFLLGEGPHWDERVQALYFVSINEKTIHKYDPAKESLTSATLEGRPGFIVPLEDHLDHFVVGLERDFVVIQWDGTGTARVVRKLGEVDQQSPRNRLNDGKADPTGRLFAGTIGHEDEKFNLDKNTGSLYRLDSHGLTALCDKISISNGLAWDLKSKAMYYIDSPERKIRRYDYDVETGDISNLQYMFDFETNKVEGAPDGCTIDTNGNLWVAVFGGGCVLQISPEGELMQRVEVPAKQVTSCTFGGAKLDTLYVTTARLNIAGEQKHPSGCTFKITGLEMTGLPNNRFNDTL
ncbi:regucalcin-like isoform X2 [Cydia strobilella]|uniref:regucalcin-like isoform X2 n=1 Tax=Cydia strobilella TaxID=1100964 RepID=UPI00300420DE